MTADGPSASASEDTLSDRIRMVGVALTAAIESESRRPWNTKAPPFAESACGLLITGADDATQRAAALWALRYWLDLERRGGPFPAPGGVTALLTTLARRPLAWTGEEALLALRWTQTVGYALPAHYTRMRIPLHAVEAAWPVMSEAQRDQARPILLALREELKSIEYDPPTRKRISQHLSVVLGEAGEDAETRLLRLFAPDDGLSALLDGSWRETAKTPAGLALLEHCASLTAATPSATWLRRGRELVTEVGDGERFLRSIVQAVPHVRDQPVIHHSPGGSFEGWAWLGAQSVETVRGAVALVGTLPDLDIAAELAEVAIAAAAGDHWGATRQARVANTAVAALAKIESVEAVRALARVQARVKNLSILKGVTKALDAAAARSGTSHDALLEDSAPEHGFTDIGLLQRSVGEHVATLSATLNGVTLSFRTAQGRALRGVPARIRDGHTDELSALRTLVTEVKKDLKSERLRIENILPSARTWDGPTWARLYLDHPLTGVVTRGLLWQVSHNEPAGADHSWVTGWVDDQGVLRDPGGSDLHARTARAVRLWHPSAVSPGEVRQWRDHIADAELRQPFKQAFREVYLLTPAEQATGQYSNRFAAHVVRYPQFAGLLRTRGWSGTSLAHWDGENAPFAGKEIGGYRVELFYDPAESDLPPGWDEAPALAITDQVRFYDRRDGEWTLLRVDAVPPLVFSEAMRDVDLFVGVTSIARDPHWADRGDTQYNGYWRHVAFGDLTESAIDRRDVLARLLPQTTIADRTSLTDRFLIVRGDLRTYKIHLGSGNILMEPNDAYLCIVLARGAAAKKHREKVYLPFEDDGGLLSEILSKAFLLAADTAITDDTIRQQITTPGI